MTRSKRLTKGAAKFLKNQRKWFRVRLDDKTLLDGAMQVPVGARYFDVAVPVGGIRRGGYLAFSYLRDARKAAQILAGRPGFPSVRVIVSNHRDTAHNVAWGEEPPDPDNFADVVDYDAAAGEFYGYSRQAILKFLRQRR